MAFCPNCGAEVKEGAAFCPSCGAPVNKAAEPTPAPQPQPQAAPAYTAPQPQYQAPYQAPVQQKASGQLNTGMLVFSIINIFFCTIFGIIALIMTITAKDKPTAEEEQKALKTAKTLNIIGIIFGILSIVISIIVGVVVPLIAAGTMANW
ncbi:MAG: zinc-ribbon domain-containing protein [Clostridia bacterium]|nr:zinc-ribbon domain-containing protein [Clostridia bacterium]